MVTHVVCCMANNSVADTIYIVASVPNDSCDICWHADTVEGVLSHLRSEGERRGQHVRPNVLRRLRHGRPSPNLCWACSSDAIQQPGRNPFKFFRHVLFARQKVHSLGGRKIPAIKLDKGTACQVAIPDAVATNRHNHRQRRTSSPQSATTHWSENVSDNVGKPSPHGCKVAIVSHQKGVVGLREPEHRRGDVNLGRDVVVHPVPVHSVGDPLHEVVPNISAHRVRDDHGFFAG
mmetsp:Transcript_55202/g.117753  ORF Transcript_55202/g.117753 Transcript_55202/m.117753 type:complete len:234 (-) Transcript_55202:839-1540(-)